MPMKQQNFSENLFDTSYGKLPLSINLLSESLLYKAHRSVSHCPATVLPSTLGIHTQSGTGQFTFDKLQPKCRVCPSGPVKS